MQYQLLRLLAGVHGNLCVVGDDDQSIYRWRGAEVDNILDFPKHFPGTRGGAPGAELPLARAASSTAAHAVIEQEPRGARRRSSGPQRARASRSRVLVADDERDEGAAHRLRAVRARTRAGPRTRSMAVFYRANAQRASLEEALRPARVPYRWSAGASFYDRAEVKDVAAYLRLMAEPALRRRLLRVDQRAAARHRRHHRRAPAGLGEPAGALDLGGDRLRRSGAAGERARQARPVQGADREAAGGHRPGRRRGRRHRAGDRPDRVRRSPAPRGRGGRGPDREPPGARRRRARVRSGVGRRDRRRPPPRALRRRAGSATKPLEPNALTQTRAQYLRAVRAAPGALGSPQETEDPPATARIRARRSRPPLRTTRTRAARTRRCSDSSSSSRWSATRTPPAAATGSP